jgi:hypothetical protein
VSSLRHWPAFLWNLPNTLVGLVWTVLGLVGGARLRIVGGALEVTRHRLMRRGCAVTLGQVVAYAPDVGPLVTVTGAVSFRDHERQHVRQGAQLGPFYLPSQLAGGLAALARDGRWHGRSNWNERGPLSDPPRPWGV